MIVQCPHCLQRFHLTDKEAGTGSGNVRCGACMKAFTAVTPPSAGDTDTASLTTTMPSSPLSAERLKELASNSGAGRNNLGGDGTGTRDHADPMNTRDNDRIEPVLSHKMLPLDNIQPNQLDADVLNKRHSTPARFSTQGSLGRWLNYCLGIPLSLLLIVALLLQLRLIHPGSTAHPILRSACELIGCVPATWQFSMNYVNVDSRNTEPKTLLFEGIIQNSTTVALSHPALQLELMDNQGRVSAQRIFTPQEYLSPAESNSIEAGQSFAVTLEVIDPGLSALHYRFTIADDRFMLH